MGAGAKYVSLTLVRGVQRLNGSAAALSPYEEKITEA